MDNQHIYKTWADMTAIEFNKTELSSYMELVDKSVWGNNMLISLFYAASTILFYHNCHLFNAINTVYEWLL